MRTFATSAQSGITRMLQSLLSDDASQRGEQNEMRNLSLGAQMQGLAADARIKSLKADRLQNQENNLMEYGAARSDATLPEFRDFRKYRQTGEMPMADIPKFATEFDDDGNRMPTQAPKYNWSPERQSQLSKGMLEALAAMSSTADFGPTALPGVSKAIADADIRGHEESAISQAMRRLAQGGVNEEIINDIRPTLAAVGQNVPYAPAQQLSPTGKLLHELGIDPQSPQGQRYLRGTLDKSLRDPSAASAGKPPTGYRFTPDGNLQAIPGGPADTKAEGTRSTAAMALDNSTANLDRLVFEARAIQNDPALTKITGVMGALPNMPGSEASNVQARLESLKSQVAFSVLQAMRDASKTGGALGQVSDREISFLQNNLAALDTTQSPEAFRKNLQQIIDYAEGVKRRMQGAYAQQFGGQVNGGSSGSFHQAPPAPAQPSGGVKFLGFE